MALFTVTTRRDYAQGHMPQPTLGDGPWGEAIEYWLNQRRWQQADIVRALEALYPPAKGKKAKGNKNTVSTAARGFDCNTQTLRRIARALEVPLDQVLVSPLRRAANEDRRKLALDITEQVLRRMESAGSPVALPAEVIPETAEPEPQPLEPPYAKNMHAVYSEFDKNQAKKPSKKPRKQATPPKRVRRK